MDIWTLGTWKVKTGREDEFAQAWQEFAGWTSQNQPGAGLAYLLQDTTDPQKFVSFGPWESADAVGAWRSTPEFQTFLAKARELCDEVQPHLLRQRAQVG